jgi:hypothetical protein
MRNTNVYKMGILTFFVLMPIFLFSQKSSSHVTLELNHFVGDKKLVLDDSTYVNSMNQSFTISKFTYYIGQLKFNHLDGSSFFMDDYYLISEDEEKIASKSISFNSIPEGEYQSIEFILGVDSARNCSGAQSGALDPINAMFWTWNTGYIFLKLEGKSKFSSAPGTMLEYHIGGFKKEDNCIRNVKIPFNQSVKIGKNNSVKIQLKVDITEILNSPTTIDFSKIPVVNNPINATVIADNYADIFQLIEVQNEK